MANTIVNTCAITPVWFRQGVTEDGKPRLIRAPLNVVQIYRSGTSGDKFQGIQPAPMPDASIYAADGSTDVDYVRSGGGYLENPIVIGQHELGAWNGMSDQGPMWGLHSFGWL